MTRPADDFDKDLPLEEMVDGLGAFTERRCLLFIEMIGLAAKDLLQPEDSALHRDAKEWLEDPKNVAFWCSLLAASDAVAPIVCKAVRERPAEIARACEDMVRVVHSSPDSESADFRRFMQAMGMPNLHNRSSLLSDESAHELVFMTP